MNIKALRILLKKDPLDFEDSIKDACDSCDTRVLNELLTRCSTYNIEYGLYYSCTICNIELVKFFIAAGAKDWNLAYEGAFSSGSTEILNLIIQCNKKPMYYSSGCYRYFNLISTILDKYSRIFKRKELHPNKILKFQLPVNCDIEKVIKILKP